MQQQSTVSRLTAMIARATAPLTITVQEVYGNMFEVTIKTGKKVLNCALLTAEERRHFGY